VQTFIFFIYALRGFVARRSDPRVGVVMY